MDESRLWGGIGVGIALLGLVLLAFDPHFVEVATRLDFSSGMFLYGVGVIVAVLLTMAIILPTLFRGNAS